MTIPQLRAKWPDIYSKFLKLTGNELIITCTYRSVEEQQRLYAQGRSTRGPIVTYVDGIKKRSNHNHFPARAIDVAVLSGGKINWEPQAYEPLGIIANEFGLRWGGSFRTFQDPQHIEIV